MSSKTLDDGAEAGRREILPKKWWYCCMKACQSFIRRSKSAKHAMLRQISLWSGQIWLVSTMDHRMLHCFMNSIQFKFS